MNTYEVTLRNGKVEMIEADFANASHQKISFHVQRERKSTTMEKLIDDKETVKYGQLVAEYALSQIVGWKMVGN